MKEYKIVGEHLTKQYKNRKVVNDVSMHVVNGEIYGPVGFFVFVFCFLFFMWQERVQC